MRSGNTFSIFILAIFFLGSCIPTKVINFQSLQPASFVVPPSEDSILVLNLSYYPWTDTMDFNMLKNLSDSEAFIVDTMINNTIFDGLFTILDQSEFENLRKTKYSEARASTLEDFLKPIDIESVNYLCNEFNTDIILALEYYGFQFKQDYGSYDWHIITRTKTVWRTYFKDSGLIDERIKTDTFYFDGYFGSMRNYNLKKDPDVIKAMKESFKIAGENYGTYLSPYWQDVMSLYYIFYYQGENISLDLEGLTRFISESENNIRKYKAWINLAVYYEKSGDPPKALSAVNEALQIRPKSGFAKAYKKDIEEAVKNKIKLDNQFEQIIIREE